VTAHGGPTVVRPAGPDDVDALLEVQRSSALTAFAHIFPPERYPFPSAVVRAHWAKAVSRPSARVFLAEQAGRAVGLSAVVPGQLESLFVIPSCWGTGTADILYRHALERLAEWPADEYRLWVLEANARARRFYERRSWRPDGRRSRTSFPPRPWLVGYTLGHRQRET